MADREKHKDVATRAKEARTRRLEDEAMAAESRRLYLEQQRKEEGQQLQQELKLALLLDDQPSLSYGGTIQRPGGIAVEAWVGLVDGYGFAYVRVGSSSWGLQVATSNGMKSFRTLGELGDVLAVSSPLSFTSADQVIKSLGPA